MKKELMDYIQSVLSKGFKPEQIKQALRQAGYEEAEIQEAFAGISQPKSNTLAIFIIICFLVGAFVLILFLAFNLLGSSPVVMPQKIIPQQSTQGCNEKAPGQWCYQVVTESVTSGSCSATKEECINTYYADLAAANKDEKLCSKIADQQAKDMCNSNVASRKNDLAVCDNLSDPEQKTNCIGTIAGQQKDKALCNAAPSKDDCYISYAVTTKDASICELASTADKKQQCEFFATPPPPVPAQG